MGYTANIGVFPEKIACLEIEVKVGTQAKQAPELTAKVSDSNGLIVIH
jgi:hypothetical protein